MLASYTTPEGIADALKVINHRPLTIAQRLQVTEDSLGGAEAALTALKFWAFFCMSCSGLISQ